MNSKYHISFPKMFLPSKSWHVTCKKIATLICCFILVDLKRSIRQSVGIVEKELRDAVAVRLGLYLIIPHCHCPKADTGHMEMAPYLFLTSSKWVRPGLRSLETESPLDRAVLLGSASYNLSCIFDLLKTLKPTEEQMPGCLPRIIIQSGEVDKHCYIFHKFSN